MRRLTVSFTLIFLAALAVDAYPGLRGGGGWRWPYQAPDSAVPVIVLAVVLAVYLLGVYALRWIDARPRVALAWMVLGGTVIGYAVTGIPYSDAPFTLFTRTVSPVQTGASTVAVREMADNGLDATLQNWPDVMREALDANIIHFTTSPPGQPLIHYGLAEATNDLPSVLPFSMAMRQFQCADADIMRYSRGEIGSAGLIGLLMPFFAALAVIPIYAVGGMLSGDDNQRAGQALPLQRNAGDIALRLAAWWPLVPTVLLFTPTWNTLYPALSVWAFALLLRGLLRLRLGRRGHPWIVAGGVVMSFTTFLNFAVAPVFLLFGLFTLGYWWINRTELGSFVWAVRVGVAFGVGLLSVWIGFGVVSGHTPLDLAQVTAEKHSDLVAGRDYLTWLLLHPYDVLMFVGWPLAALFVWGLLRVNPRSLTPTHILAGSMLITFIAVNVAGVVQGENARILAFYAPFLLLVGGGWLMSQAPRGDWPLLAAQAACVLVMAAVLPVVPLDLNLPPDGPNPDVPMLDFMEPIPINAPFNEVDADGVISLESYRFVADVAAQTITLETIWRGYRPTERPYVFEVVASAENEIDGPIEAETHTFSVQNGNYPPTCWQDGEIIRDVTQIDLPVISAPVAWTLTVSPVDPRTGGGMILQTPPFLPVSEQVSFGPIPYP